MIREFEADRRCWDDRIPDSPATRAGRQLGCGILGIDVETTPPLVRVGWDEALDLVRHHQGEALLTFEPGTPGIVTLTLAVSVGEDDYTVVAETALSAPVSIRVGVI